MAERVFVMPDLGEGLEEGRIVRWLAAEGATVELNQPLVEVETAKFFAPDIGGTRFHTDIVFTKNGGGIVSHGHQPFSTRHLSALVWLNSGLSLMFLFSPHLATVRRKRATPDRGVNQTEGMKAWASKG